MDDRDELDVLKDIHCVLVEIAERLRALKPPPHLLFHEVGEHIVTANEENAKALWEINALR